ncbi:unnamed protein product [Prorocentrum cordatum]|uniref:Integrase catalytic domain-containing protein n=1 Tax=Prorocentrum cordatum TaxID=2364126 RepID=A0ABN9QGS8_9DINO|nr:unnamed protein product [Polarella glacialis]
MVVVMRMFAKSRCHKLIDSVLGNRLPVTKALAFPTPRVASYKPDTRTGSSTRMAYFPEDARTRLHPDNGERECTVPAGKFKECLYCGAVWEAEKYPFKLGKTQSTEAIFWNLHGTRQTPGAKIDRLSTAASASSPYVPPSSLARWSLGGLAEDYRPQAGPFSEFGRAGGTLSAGQARRYLGMARSAYQTISLEKDVCTKKLNASKFPRRHRRGVDPLEVFGGERGITIRAAGRARGWNVRGLQPIDKFFGQDFKIQQERRNVLSTIDKWQPRLVVIQLPCRLWTLLNRNVNYKDRAEVLEGLQDEERCFLTFAADIFNKQKHYGNHALLENPATADSFCEDVIMQLRQDNYECTSNMCMFGMVGKDGLPMKKLVRSQVYTWQLADAICRGLTRVIEPEEFCHGVQICSYYPVSYDKPASHVHQVCYAAPNMEEPPWRAIMSGVVDIMSRRNAGSATVAKDSEMWKQVEELIPWQLLSIQAAFQPKAKRLRPEFGHDVHQCSVLVQEDNQLVIEHEYVPDAYAPRERFQTPSHLDLLSEASHDNLCQFQRQVSHSLRSSNRLPFSSAPVTIWFAGPPLTAEEKRAAPIAARMHQNLSHPLQPDSTRFLNSGDASQVVIDLRRRLRCSSCLRNVKPRRPRPGKIPYIGSFNSRVGLDFFYLPDAAHNTHQFLGILEMSGLLRMVVYCPTRDPAHVLEVFTMCWLSWAGYPDHVVRDRDGAFQAIFVEHLDEHEVLVEKIPAEAPWQSGRVEANIALWKHMAQRVIDAMQLIGPDDMKLMTVPINQSRIWRVRQCGASPYQWTFGKDPRIPDSITDPANSAVVHSAMTADAELAKRARIRVLADMAFTEYDRSDSLRRSMLRVNRPNRGDYTAGDRVAFWRLPKNKKGKQYPARFIVATVIGPGGSGGPDDNNVWVQSSGHPILVSKEQLREAHGTEMWVPDDTDLAELRRVAVSVNSRHIRKLCQGHRRKLMRLNRHQLRRRCAITFCQPFDLYQKLQLPKEPVVPVFDSERDAHDNMPVREVYLTTNGQFTMAKKDQKALIREIPWSQIPDGQKQLYRGALAREWSSWQRFSAVEVLDLKISKQIELDVEEKKRIIPSRVCYRDKNAVRGVSEIDAKARLVGVGRNDPDILTLRRDAPTLTRAGFYILLQVVASWNCNLFGGDVTAAFPQGALLLVRRSIYGFVNSPRLWWRKLRDFLISIGGKQCLLDKALFCFYKAGRLVLIVGIHVGDLIGGVDPIHGADLVDKIRNRFTFGKWWDNELTYCGKRVVKQADCSVFVNQCEFSAQCIPAPLPRWRSATPDATLSAEEKTHFSSGVGSCQWLVGQSRPDLAAATSLGQGSNPTISNLMAINRILREARDTKDAGLTIVGLDFLRAVLATFTDAAWATAQENLSQAGFMVFCADVRCLTSRGGAASLLDWRSHRIRRVVRSTLAAEAMAMDAGVDTAYFLRHLFAEILFEDFRPGLSGKLPADFRPIKVATDCKSLYDILTKEGTPSTTLERRLSIDIAAVAHTAEDFDDENPKHTVFWVPTDKQIADHLAKVKPPGQLRELLFQSWLSLRSDQNLPS